jgi:hypothetical protein
MNNTFGGGVLTALTFSPELADQLTVLHSRLIPSMKHIQLTENLLRQKPFAETIQKHKW